MDKVSLALFGKINKMFVENQPELFMAFNPAAVPYEPTTFIRDIHTEVNTPLKTSAFREPTGRDTYIWNSYKETLDHAEAASSNWDEEAWLNYEILSNELAAMEETYQRYKKEYDDLVAERKGEHSALLELTNEADREEKQYRIVELDQLVSQKLAEWKTRGKKLQYESTLNKIINAEPEYPVQVIQKYKADLEAAEIGGDVLSGQMAYSTGYTPSDFFEEHGSGWINFDLDKDEVEKMYRYALDTVFADQREIVKPNANDDQLEIERISGELGTLHIKRDWLNNNFFHAGYWQLAPGFESEILSDGDPRQPEGRMPAFVEKVLFIKKLDIELKANSSVNENTIEKNQANGTPILFGNMVLKLPAQQKASQITNISKPTRINAMVASKYRAAAYSKRNVNLQQLFSASSSFKLKASLNFYNQIKLSTLQAATISSPTSAGSKVSSAGSSSTSSLLTPSAVTSARILQTTGGRNVAPRSRGGGLPTGTLLNLNTNKYHINMNQVNVGVIQSALQYGFEGMVRSADNKPLAGVKLIFTDTVDPRKEYVITTGNDGKYKVVLPAAPYKLEVDHDGFFRYATKLGYRKGEKLQIKSHNLTLSEDPESEIEDQFSFVCLGMLCRKLPKSPNPDPNLQWD